MITITRNQALQLRAVFRRCGIKPSVHSGDRANFSAGPDGLHVRAAVFDVAVDYHVPGELPAEEFSLPLECLDRCEGRRDEPVTLDLQPRNRVLVSWTDGGVPQQAQYDAKLAAKAIPFPDLPEQFAENSADLRPALGHARETTDHGSTRYALTHIQLSGAKGQIVTTDGRQVLFQRGFQFPWTDDVLIPAPAVLGWAELTQNNSIGVGRTKDCVALRLGPWTILLRIDKEATFPRVDEALPAADSIKSRLILTDSDADFLAQVLPRLPCHDDHFQPVTLDLNGHIAVRAKSPEGRATEVVLSGSRLAGEPLLINSDRRLLAHAVKLGFRELGVRDSAAPLVCCDERRRYGWMSLGDGDAIQASDSMIRIASPTSGTEVVPIPKTLKRSRAAMSDNSTDPNCTPGENSAATTHSQTQEGAVAATPATVASKRRSSVTTNRKPGRQTVDSPIEQAVALKQSLRQTLTQTSELIRALKRQKKQSRMINSTLKSLKELQQAG